MTALMQNKSQKVMVTVCLLIGLLGSLILWSRVRNDHAFNIHDFDHSSGDGLKSALLSHVPLGSQFEEVANFLDQNGFHKKDASANGGCGDDYYVSSKGITIITCTNSRFWNPTGWAILFRFDENKELHDIEIMGWPT